MGRPHHKLQPRLETVVSAPNLLYPNGLNKEKSDTTFYEALDFPILRESILGSFLIESRFPREKRSYDEDSVYRKVQDQFDFVFNDGIFDPALANYRLDIMQFLKLNNDAQQNFEFLFDGLAHLANIKKGKQEESEMIGLLKKGKVYCDLIRGYNQFSANAPEGLQRVNQHIEAVRSSEAYRKLENIVAKTQNGFHLQMTWRCNGFLKGNEDYFEKPLQGRKVVSAAILPLNDNINEFGSAFDLNHFNERGDFYSRQPVEQIISRAIQLKFKRHFVNAQEQIRQTLELFPQVAVYLADLKYQERLERKGVHFTRPTFLDKEEGRASFQNIHHPLVTEGKDSIGNPVEYDSLHPITVITGPNKGGKSVYVKAIGVAHARGLKGFFAPAERAEFSFRDGIYTHFIKPEDITKGESRFSDEMKRMESIFKKATPHSIVLLDEPCGGTTLSAGVIKTREFLEVFGELGCPVFITTHMEEIAKAVAEGKIPKSLNKHLSFTNDDGQIRYRYNLVDGPAEMDYGEQIADSLGLGADRLRQLLADRSRKEGFQLKK